MISRPDLSRLLVGAGLAAMLGIGAARAAPGQLETAREALARGDTIAADVALDRAEEAGATTRALAVVRGETCLLANDLECARRWLEPGEFADDEAVRGFQLLGRLERQAGDANAAAQAYNRAIALDDRNADLWIDIAEFRFAYSEEAIAYDALAFALQLEPGLPRALALQARLVRQRDGWLPSLPFFVQALDIAPQDSALMADYSAVLGEADRASEFLAISRSAVALGSGPRAWYQQAVLAARAGDFETARGLMERLPSASDTDGAAILRAISEMKVGSLRNAQQTLERLHRGDPEDRTVARLLAKSLALGDRNEALVTLLAPIASRDDADPYLKTAVARAYERLGRRRDAAPLLDSAPQTGARGFVGKAAFGSSVGAVAYSQDPRRFDNARDYVRGLIGEDRADHATTIAEDLATRFPNARDPRVLAGDAAFAAHDMAAALEHYEAAAEIRYTDRLLLRIVAVLEADDRAGEARRVAQSYLARRPGNALASRIVAVQAANVGNWGLARDLLTYLLQSSGANDVLLMSLLSQALTRLGDPDEALVWAERAMDRQPMNALAAASLKLALEGAGDKDAARKAGLYPDDTRFPRALNRLRETAASGG